MSIREDIKAFIDNELSPERAAEVQAAIESDPALRAEVEFMKELSGEIKMAASEPQVKGMEKAMDRVEKPASPWMRWTGYSVAGALGIFILGAIFFPVFAQSKASAKRTAELSLRKQEALRNQLREDAPAPASPDGDAVGGGDPTLKEPETGRGGLQNNYNDLEARTESETLVDEGANVFGRTPATNERKYKSTVRTRAGKWEAQSKSPTLPPTVFEPNRLVVRTADVGLKVPDVAKSVEETEKTVMAMGGIIGRTDFDMAVDGSRATMDFKIPVKNFSAILDALGKLGKIIRKSTNGEDVTAQVADTSGRIRALADEEHNLIAELRRARTSDVRLEIRSRLSSVRQEMEGMKQQNIATKDLAAMSRVTVGFEQAGQLDEGKTDDWFNQTTEGAGSLLGLFGRIFGVGLIYALYLAPVWIPIVGAVWWMKRKARVA